MVACSPVSPRPPPPRARRWWPSGRRAAVAAVLRRPSSLPRLARDAASPARLRTTPGPVLLVPGYGGSDPRSLQTLADRLDPRPGRDATVVRGARRRHWRPRCLRRPCWPLRSTTPWPRTGAVSVDVVGYSAGGATARLWAADGGAEQARRVLTLGVPHHGTTYRRPGLGRGCPSECPEGCRQLTTDSELLARLNAGDETPDGPTWVSVWTTADTTSSPRRSPPSSTVPWSCRVQDVCADSRWSRTASCPPTRWCRASCWPKLAPGPPVELGRRSTAPASARADPSASEDCPAALVLILVAPVTRERTAIGARTPPWLPRSATPSSSTSCAGSTGCVTPLVGRLGRPPERPAGRSATSGGPTRSPVVAAGVAAAPRFARQAGRPAPAAEHGGHRGAVARRPRGGRRARRHRAGRTGVAAGPRPARPGPARRPGRAAARPAPGAPTGRTRWAAPGERGAAAHALAGRPAAQPHRRRPRRAAEGQAAPPVRWRTCPWSACSAATPPSARGCARPRPRPPRCSTDASADRCGDRAVARRQQAGSTAGSVARLRAYLPRGG